MRTCFFVAPRSLRSCILATFPLLLVGALQPLHAQNLLLNESFENALTGWNIVSGSATTVSYGTADVPSAQVANWIGGGGQLLRDGNGLGCAVEQIIAVGPLGANTRVRVSGYFGGTGGVPDQARMVVRFLNSSASELSRVDLPYVSVAARNSETVLMLREALLAPHTGTESIAVLIEMQNLLNAPGWASVDKLSLELTTDSLTPPPLPLMTELLVNSNFDQGWSASSPLTLVDRQGWEGTSGQTVTRAYSDADPNVPATVVSTIIGGGPRLATQASLSSGLMQRLDIRGNAAQGSQLELQLSAYLGGLGQSADRARVQAVFLGENFAPVGSVVHVGSVTEANRHLESVVLRCEARAAVPSDARYIDISLELENWINGPITALADKLSAQLRTPSAVQRVQLNTNMVANGGFEDGSLPGSVLQLNDANYWKGITGEPAPVVPYGLTNGTTPSTGFATSNSLGGLCLRALGNKRLAKMFSLAGYDTAINQGRLHVDASAWLGGHSTVPDDARVHVRFLNSQGGQVGVPVTLGPVTPAHRNNLTTLLPRSSSAQLLPTTATLAVEVEYQDLWGGVDWALADNIEVSLRDTAQPGLNYCTSTINSTGATALMSANGTNSIAADDLVLRASPVPVATAGLFFYGFNRAQAPFGNGIRCIAPPLTRFPVVTANNNGVLVFPVDYASSQIAAGATLHFQAWFRDAAAGGATFTTSDGYELSFVP
jgi:hypothetical protein